MTRQRVILLVALVTVALGAGVAIVAADDVTDIGTDHTLATDEAMSEWETHGYAEGESHRYQLDLAVAERRADVGAEDALATNIRNHFLRINYQEDYDRTLRILIPRDVITPYRAEEVDSLTSAHSASLQPARNGDYLAVTVDVDGEADIVLPLNRDHAVSYRLVERFDSRMEQLTGFSPLDREEEWQYIDGVDLADNSTMELNHSFDDVVIQFDATPDESHESWINMPEGQTAGAPLYALQRDGDDTVTIVTTTDDPPDVRYRTDSTVPAKVRGWATEARQIPGEIYDRIKDLIPGGDRF